VSAQEREWQPGDKALIEVEVGDVAEVHGELVATVRPVATPTAPGAMSFFSTALADSLRPVSAAGEVESAAEAMTTLPETAMRAAMSAFAKYNSGRIPDDVVPHAIGAVIWAALDAVGGVPGPSEAEIRAEVLSEVQAHGVALDKGRGIVCLCGEVCNAVMGRSPARIMGSTSDEYVHINAGTVFAQHLRDVRARVAGTTEAGDDRG